MRVLTLLNHALPRIVYIVHNQFSVPPFSSPIYYMYHWKSPKSHKRNFNHDSNLTDHANLMTTLDAALQSFNQAMEEIGMENSVTTFTISDFGRKLVSNGDGTDHAWGGHAMVMGGAVQGKKIYGEYPDKGGEVTWGGETWGRRERVRWVKG